MLVTDELSNEGTELLKCVGLGHDLGLSWLMGGCPSRAHKLGDFEVLVNR